MHMPDMLCLVALCCFAVGMGEVAQHLLYAEGSRSSFLRATVEDSREQRSLQKAATQLENDLLAQETPHGPLIKSLRIDRPGLGPMTCDYADPKALLWASMCLSPQLTRLVVDQAASGRPCKVVLATDDVKPGNALRPDKGRTYYALYFTLLCLPHWYLRSPFGWWSILYIRAKIVDQSPSGLSELIEYIVLQIFPGWVISLTDDSNGVYTITLEWGFLTGDEKALKTACTCKGAGAYRCCMKCKNIFGRLAPDRFNGEPYFRHHSTPSRAEFDEYTPEAWREVIEHVRHSWENDPRDVALRTEMHFGVTFNGGRGLQWGAAAAIVNLPAGIHYDSMHCFWASGGTAQYECNQFLRRVYDLGITPRQVQSFCEEVRCFTRGSIFDIKDRVRNGDELCIKCFADEVLQLVSALMFFISLALDARGLLQAECECFASLFCMLWIYTSGDGAVANSHVLEQLLEEHQRQFVALYPFCLKPKNHLVRHTPGEWAHINNFVVEHKHRESKQMAAYVFRHIDTTLIKRLTLKHLRWLQDPTNFDPFALTEGRTSYRKSLLQHAGLFKEMRLEPVAHGLAMRSCAGVCKRQDLLLWRTASGGLGVGLALDFYHCRCTGDGSVSPIVIVSEWPIMRRTRDFLVCQESKFLGVLNASNIARRLAYMKVNGDCYVLVPRCLEQLIT